MGDVIDFKREKRKRKGRIIREYGIVGHPTTGDPHILYVDDKGRMKITKFHIENPPDFIKSFEEETGSKPIVLPLGLYHYLEQHL